MSQTFKIHRIQTKTQRYSSKILRKKRTTCTVDGSALHGSESFLVPDGHSAIIDGQTVDNRLSHRRSEDGTHFFLYRDVKRLSSRRYIIFVLGGISASTMLILS
jgi:hypothetical protein